MTLDQAIAILRHRADIKRVLANAPRTSDCSRAVAQSHRLEVEAIDIVLAALPITSTQGEASNG